MGKLNRTISHESLVEEKPIDIEFRRELSRVESRKNSGMKRL